MCILCSHLPSHYLWILIMALQNIVCGKPCEDILHFSRVKSPHSSSLIWFLTLDCIFPSWTSHRITLGFKFSLTSVIDLSTSCIGHWYHLPHLLFPLSPTLNFPNEMVAGSLPSGRYQDREREKTCYPRTPGEAESVRLGRWAGFGQEYKGLIWGTVSGSVWN